MNGYEDMEGWNEISQNNECNCDSCRLCRDMSPEGWKGIDLAGRKFDLAIKLCTHPADRTLILNESETMLFRLMRSTGELDRILNRG